MPNKLLAEEFKSGLTGRLYYLWSEDNCFLEDALSRCIGIVAASGPVDFNYDAFHPSSNPQEIIDAASTLPLMAQRRLVVLKDFHQFPASAVRALTRYFNEPSETTCMVVLSQKKPKAAYKFNWKIYPLNIGESDMPAWLKREATEKGLKLTDEAVDCLIEFMGHEPGLLTMEIEKLASSGSGTITEKDIISSTSMMRKYTPFDLIDSIIAGQRTRAFRILKAMFAGNVADAPVIIGALNWHYKQFYSLWQRKGKRPVKMREKTYGSLVKHLSSYCEDDFYRIFKILHEADLGVKTSGRSELVVEVLLIKLLQKGTWN